MQARKSLVTATARCHGDMPDNDNSSATTNYNICQKKFKRQDFESNFFFHKIILLVARNVTHFDAPKTENNGAAAKDYVILKFAMLSLFLSVPLNST